MENIQDVIFTLDIQKYIDEIKPKLIIIDENVNKESYIKYDRIFVIKISETTKNFEKYLEILNILEDNNINKNDTVALVGGGVLLDVAGFACCTYKRGVNRINIPTTLLAMVDASIGGKCGINYKEKKNLIGNISLPLQTVIDINFLNSLDQRQINNGMAEIIKVAVLDNKYSLLELLENNDYNMLEIIKRAIKVKRLFIDCDLNDNNQRRMLNLGHTYGHAIESYYNFDKYLHGEAISLGITIASNYNNRIINVLKKNNLPVYLNKDIDFDELTNLMFFDKKNTDEDITYIQLNELFTPTLEKATVTDMKKKLKNTLILSDSKIKENITVNNSKSLIHRLLILSLIQKAKYQFSFNPNIDLSDDISTTIEILRKCNIDVVLLENKIEINSENIQEPNDVLNFNKSATSLRIILPLITEMFGNVNYTMDNQLKSRPTDELQKYYMMLENEIRKKELPEVIEVSGSISSQYISGYIYTSVFLNEDRIIKINGNLTSVNYIMMTIDVLQRIGANIRFDLKSKQIYVKKVESLSLNNKFFESEIDYSNYAFFAVFNKLQEIRNEKFKVTIQNKISNSMQADYQIIEILENDDYEIDMTNIPDLLPVLMVYGALNKKGIKLNNIKRIKYKECDRIMVMKENLENLGIKVDVEMDKNYLIVHSTCNISGGYIKTYDDHRIAMSFGILHFFIDGNIVIDNLKSVNKSYPEFWNFILGENNVNIK